MKSVCIGERYGKLVALERTTSSSKGEIQLICQCDCGNRHVAKQHELLKGHTKSCGCLRSEVGKKRGLQNTKHGLSSDRIYTIWSRMMDRCYNPSNNRYDDYGGRGVQVCDEWHELTRFHQWALSSGYSDNLSIDRKDVDGNYEPDNCKWSSVHEQSVNKRNSIWVNFNGENLPLTDVSIKTGIPYSTLYGRLKRGDQLIK